jgi:hypothetical protein
MFYHQKHHHAHGFLFIVILAAFLLGRKSEQYGFTIISRGCGSNTDVDDEMDMMNDPNLSTPSYPR